MTTYVDTTWRTTAAIYITPYYRADLVTKKNINAPEAFSSSVRRTCIYRQLSSICHRTPKGWSLATWNLDTQWAHHGCGEWPKGSFTVSLGRSFPIRAWFTKAYPSASSGYNLHAEIGRGLITTGINDTMWSHRQMGGKDWGAEGGRRRKKKAEGGGRRQGNKSGQRIQKAGEINAENRS